MASEAEVVPMRITGLLSTVSGRNGSGARTSRQPKASDSTNEAAIRPRICGESQAIARAAPGEREQERNGRAHHQHGAEHVELVACGRGAGCA